MYTDLISEIVANLEYEGWSVQYEEGSYDTALTIRGGASAADEEEEWLVTIQQIK